MLCPLPPLPASLGTPAKAQDSHAPVSARTHVCAGRGACGREGNLAVRGACFSGTLHLAGTCPRRGQGQRAARRRHLLWAPLGIRRPAAAPSQDTPSSGPALPSARLSEKKAVPFVQGHSSHSPEGQGQQGTGREGHRLKQVSGRFVGEWRTQPPCLLPKPAMWGRGTSSGGKIPEETRPEREGGEVPSTAAPPPRGSHREVGCWERAHRADAFVNPDHKPGLQSLLIASPWPLNQMLSSVDATHRTRGAGEGQQRPQRAGAEPGRTEGSCLA